MKLENKLSQTQTMKQALSLQQQYALKVLSLNEIDLNKEIEAMIEENPLLEYTDEAYDSFNQHDTFEIASRILSQPVSLSEILIEQLNTTKHEINHQLAQYLIDSLDSNGYLPLTNKQIQGIFDLDEDEIEETIAILQTFEPIGVFARNIQESLLIQIVAKNHPLSQIALIIVNDYLEELSLNQLQKIALQSTIPFDTIQQAVSFIRTLEPKPAASYATYAAYSIPEAKVKILDDQIHIELNTTSRKLKVRRYESITDEATLVYIQKYLSKAESFIHTLDKRENTLSSILSLICQYQKDFFLHHGKLVPLTYQKIANDLNLNESTISRAIANKTIEFENRNLALKSFFPSKLDSGQSSSEIHDIIKEIIQHENQQKPYSDQQIATLLAKRKITISRRTVAKYREQLNILPAANRKRF